MIKQTHVFRVKPGQELMAEVLKYCHQNNITSGIVLGIIGSATGARLNYLTELPGKFQGESYQGPLEIVSAQGTIALKGKETIVHIHAMLSTPQRCFGGHLVEATVFSTAEVAIAELTTPLTRYADSQTGLNELLR